LSNLVYQGGEGTGHLRKPEPTDAATWMATIVNVDRARPRSWRKAAASCFTIYEVSCSFSVTHVLAIGTHVEQFHARVTAEDRLEKK